MIVTLRVTMIYTLCPFAPTGQQASVTMIYTHAPLPRRGVGQRVTMIYTDACCPVGAKGQRVAMIPWKRNAQAAYTVYANTGWYPLRSYYPLLRKLLIKSKILSSLLWFLHVISFLCEYRNKSFAYFYLKKYEEDFNKPFFVLRIQRRDNGCLKSSIRDTISSLRSKG